MTLPPLRISPSGPLAPGSLDSVQGSFGITPTTPQGGAAVLSGEALLPRDGSRSMLGVLDMALQDIQNASLVNGVPLTALGAAERALREDGTYQTLVSPYTVGPLASAARFQTIQAAINQAQADGASYDQPATIYIQAGYYLENITITAPSNGGNIALVGVGDDYGTFIDGTVTVNNGGTFNGWVFQNLSISGAVNFVGTSIAGYSIFTSQCEFFQRVTVQQAGCAFRDFLSRFRTSSGADALLFSAGSQPGEYLGSRFFAASNVRAILASGTFRLCYIFGSITLPPAGGLIQSSILYADQTCLLDQTTGTSELCNCALLQVGTPAINKTGSGILRQLGNYLRPSATLPYIAIGGGAVQTGVLLV